MSTDRLSFLDHQRMHLKDEDLVQDMDVPTWLAADGAPVVLADVATKTSNVDRILMVSAGVFDLRNRMLATGVNALSTSLLREMSEKQGPDFDTKTSAGVTKNIVLIIGAHHAPEIMHYLTQGDYAMPWRMEQAIPVGSDTTGHNGHNRRITYPYVPLPAASALVP